VPIGQLQSDPCVLFRRKGGGEKGFLFLFGKKEILGVKKFFTLVLSVCMGHVVPSRGLFSVMSQTFCMVIYRKYDAFL